MRIEAVAFRNFPPFADGLVEFPRSHHGLAGEVQLITGQNGTGKTRLLCLLAAACGNPTPLNIRSESRQNATVVADDDHGRRVWHRTPGQTLWMKEGIDLATVCKATWIELNKLGNRGQSTFLFDPVDERSPRATILAFRGAARVSDAQIEAMKPVAPGSAAEHLTFEPAKNEDTIIGQSMANIKMAAAMDQLRKTPAKESRAIYLAARLEAAVSQITGREFAFDVTPYPEVCLRVYWGGVMMRLIQLPDGLRSIIGWLVSCVAKLAAAFPDHPDPLSLPLMLLLDEPEGHLHPAWQRKVLPAAQTLFPQAQIIAATHSPFVISSVNDGWIHVLRADSVGTVTFDKPRECSKGDSFIDVVEDVLGVTEWYDPETEELLARFRRTRDAVLAGNEPLEDLAALAATIAGRSESLRDIMGREMRQVERLRMQAENPA